MNLTRLNDRSGSLGRMHQCGVAAVEFALLLVFLLIIVSGLVEFGRAFWYYDALDKATRDGARFLSGSRVNSTVALDSGLIGQAEDMVVDASISAGMTDFKAKYVAIICDTACSGTPSYITVSVAYPITIGGLIPIFLTTGTATWDATLSPYTTMRYLR